MKTAEHLRKLNRNRVRKWGKLNPEKKKQQKKKSCDKTRALIALLKNKPCADCGLLYPSWVMDFDHLPGTDKKFNISAPGISFEAILEESQKCEVVCSNCHRERTHSRAVNRLG